jgi:antitoxin (DNA-binding transcriptional repressor) of toxin-antitoxin stability system
MKYGELVISIDELKTKTELLVQEVAQGLNII